MAQQSLTPAVDRLARWFDWSRWVAISSLPSICSPSFSFIGGVGKKIPKEHALQQPSISI
jgi:hypothetical protein